MLVTAARNKYRTDTFRGGDDSNMFELLCLHGFKISDVEFLSQPLTDGAQPKQVKFPAKRVLALNWREEANNYLEANVLYIPPYGNLESSNAFCLIEINGRWTLVILQCTIAEKHPVKQNGMKVIFDCYKTNPALTVDDTHGDNVHDTDEWQAEDQAASGDAGERSSGRSSASHHHSHCTVQDPK